MTRRWTTVAIAPLTALVLTACAGAVSDEYEREEPFTVEAIDGETVARITLTESAAARLGIETAPVEEHGGRLSVPYAAVYLDAHGELWVYTNPERLVFVRHPIVIARESSDRAFLAEGPPPGTRVVTVGIPELYGSETGFGT